MDLERFDLILRIRVFTSSILYAVFLGVGLHGVIAGWHFDNPTPAVVLLVVAYFCWPRRSAPKSWEPDDPESPKGRREREARAILQKKLDRVKIFYFVAAVFVLAILPFLLGEPIFDAPGWLVR